MTRVGLTLEQFNKRVEEAKRQNPDSIEYQFAVALQEAITPIAGQYFNALIEQIDDRATVVRLFATTMGAIVFSVVGPLSKEGHEEQFAALLPSVIGHGIEAGVHGLKQHRLMASAANEA
jgi:hypothetical protein